MSGSTARMKEVFFWRKEEQGSELSFAGEGEGGAEAWGCYGGAR